MAARHGSNGAGNRGTRYPTVTYEMDGVDFLRLITGRASGPKLFLFGRLKIRGNLLLAARMPGFFPIPGGDE